MSQADIATLQGLLGGGRCACGKFAITQAGLCSVPGRRHRTEMGATRCSYAQCTSFDGQKPGFCARCSTVATVWRACQSQTGERVRPALHDRLSKMTPAML
jgi:hypothetical protein